MVETLHPGTYFTEEAISVAAEGVSASVGGFVGMSRKGPIHVSKRVTSWASYREWYGEYFFDADNPHLPIAVRAYFDNGGASAWIARAVGAGADWARRALYDHGVDPLLISNVTFTGWAGNPGQWGNEVAVWTTKALSQGDTGTTLSPLDNSLLLKSVTGLEVGDVAYFWVGADYASAVIRSISGNTINFDTLVWSNVGVASFSEPFVATSTVHRARTRTSQAVTAGSSLTSLDLASASGIKEGGHVMVVPANVADDTVELIISRVDGNTIFFPSTTFPDALLSGTRVVSMEFDLLVYEEGVLIEEHRFLSMESGCEDYIQRRLGWNPSYPPPSPAVADDSESRNIVLLDANSNHSVGGRAFIPMSNVPTWDFGLVASRSFLLTYDIGAGPVAVTPTWSGARAILQSDSTSNLVSGDPPWDSTGVAWVTPKILVVEVNGGIDQIITIQNTWTTRAEVLNNINTFMVGGAAIEDPNPGKMNFTSDTIGNDSSVEVKPGTDPEVLDLLGYTVPMGHFEAGHDFADSRAVTSTEVDAVIQAATGPGNVELDYTVSPPQLLMSTASPTWGMNVADNGGDDLASSVFGFSPLSTWVWGSALSTKIWLSLPRPVRKAYFDNGLDGAEPGPGTGAETYIGDVSPDSGLQLFNNVEEVSFFSIPGAVGSSSLLPTTMQAASDWADSRANLVYISAVPLDRDLPDEAATWRTSLLNRDSSYMGLYYPYLKIAHPLYAGRLFDTPPDGFVAGVYAAQISARGPHIAPANVALKGVQDVFYRTSNADGDLLNPIGVNIVKVFPTRGIRIWGARTLWASEDGRHLVTVRNLLNFVKKTGEEALQIFIFEPINNDLFLRIRTTMQDILENLWRSGAFPSATKAGAYLVKCDAETTPPSEQARNRVFCDVTLYNPARFAEAVVVRLAISSGGVSTTEL